MYILEEIKNNITKEINQIFSNDLLQSEQISYPPNSEMGDLSLPMFQLAKEQGKNPADLAVEIMSVLADKKEELGVSTVKTVGPYLNFRIDTKFLASDVLKRVNVEKEIYGKHERDKKEKIMIEFSNINTHKEYHLGHLRNICFGDSITKILNVNGFEAIPVSYVNDFGIHTAKTLWALKEFFKDEEPGEDKGEFLGNVYVRSSKESKDNKLAKGMIEVVMRGIESRKGEEYELWKKTREWSIKQFDRIYEELGVNFEKKYYESEFIDKGKEMIPSLIEKGILKESEGAVIADLEKYCLGVLVVLRSDGTATYPVADLPLAEQKFKDYSLDKSIYVVDNRQKLYFQQLFKILELMGYKQEKIHLDYDFVKLPSGMMSSRSGNSVKYSELKDRMIEKAFNETKKRHEDWGNEQINCTAKILALGAMKFEMLKMGSDQIITFDIDKALDFRGFTSAYLQYTYARICSILNKTEINKDVKNIDFSLLVEEKEHNIVLKLSKYPDIVERAGKNFDPSEIAKYLFELAQLTNDYYHAINILKTEEAQKNVRLLLILSVNQVLKNGLRILGVEVIEKM